MIFDIILVALLGYAFYYGYQKGIVYAILSFLAFLIGTIAAIRFSYIAIFYLKQWLDLSPQILSILAFVIILVLIILLAKLISVILETILKALLLNFANKLLGGVIHMLIGLYAFCILVWFGNQWGLIPDSQAQTSHAYRYIQNLAPAVVETTGKLIPLVKDSFSQYEKLLKEEYKKANENSDY